jgi:hypothetical protein
MELKKGKKNMKQALIGRYSVQWIQGGYKWVENKYSQRTTIALLNDLKQNQSIDPSTLQVFAVTHGGVTVQVYGQEK